MAANLVDKVPKLRTTRVSIDDSHWLNGVNLIKEGTKTAFYQYHSFLGQDS